MIAIGTSHQIGSGRIAEREEQEDDRRRIERVAVHDLGRAGELPREVELAGRLPAGQVVEILVEVDPEADPVGDTI